MFVSPAVRNTPARNLPPALLHEPAAPLPRPLGPPRSEPAPRAAAHGSVADRARMAQRLMVFGSW